MSTPTLRYINAAAIILMVTAVVFIIYFVMVCESYAKMYDSQTVRNTLESQKLRLENEQVAACIVTCDSLKAVRNK